MDSRRIPVIAIVLIIALRLSIGWQFLYEGLWKLDSLSGPDPWTAEGYLRNAQGPFRETFRNMTGDPDGLKLLDYGNVSTDWNNWRDRFIAHYGLDENQQAALNRLLDGTAKGLNDPNADPIIVPTSREIGPLPADVDLASLPVVFKYDADSQKMTALQPVTPSEEKDLLELVPKEAKDVRVEIGKLIDASRKVSYRQKLAAHLRGNPEMVGASAVKNEKGSFTPVMGTTTAKEENGIQTNLQYGKIQEYKDLLQEYEEALAKAKIDYQFDHAAMLKKKVDITRAEVVGPVKTIDTDLKKDAFQLLTIQQIGRGAMPPEDTPLHRASSRPMWALLILGFLLLIGLGTRGAAVGGAILLLSFYLVIPPWPGVPQPPGPEHSLFINKNMIEVIALLGIAMMPTGSWFGLDGLIARLFKAGNANASAAKPTENKPKTPAEPAKA
ncbi:MAG: hypothetical protein KDA88_09725 [Planctomycetaceae bacterium]|nr:hypothetical protein [Planctomycetaceae bacterium]